MSYIPSMSLCSCPEHRFSIQYSTDGQKLSTAILKAVQARNFQEADRLFHELEVLNEKAAAIFWFEFWSDL